MEENKKYTRPNGSPNLIRLKFQGDEILIDYDKLEVIPLGGSVKCNPDGLTKYLIDEGFFEVVKTDN